MAEGVVTSVAPADLLGRILDAAPEGILALGRDAQDILFANARAERVFGCAPGTLAGRRLAEIVTESCREPLRAYCLAPARPARPARPEAPALQDAGVIALRGRRDDRGEFPVIIGRWEPGRPDDPLIVLTVAESAGRDDRESVAVAVGLGSVTDLGVILDHVPIGLSVRDLGGRYLYVNSHFACMLRGAWTADQLIGTTLSEVFPEEIQQLIASQDAELLAGGEPLSYEIAMAPNGTRVDYASLRFLIRDADNRVIAIGAWVTETSERRRAERRAREVEGETAQLAAIIASTDDAVMSGTIDGRVRTWNPGAERLFGYTAEEAIGRGIAFVMAPRHAGRTMDWHARVVAGHQLTDVDTVARRKDGSEIVVSVTLSPVRDAAGTIIATSAIARDVSEQRAAQRELLASEERFRATFENAPIGMGLVSLDGRWLRVNRPLVEMTGYSEAQLLGMNTRDMTHPEDLDASDADRTALIAGTRRTVESDKRYVRPDGSVLWVHRSVSLARDPAGVPTHAVVQAQDITERRAEEARAAALQDELQRTRRLQGLGQLAGGVAHDFNNLLGIITIYGHLARSHSAPPVSEHVDEILAAAERGAALTRQLLTFGRHVAGPPQIVDLDAAIDDLRSLLQATLDAGVTLGFDREPAAKHVALDRDLIDQVLVNLAVNARDAMDGRGRLTIRTARIDAGPDRSVAGGAAGEAPPGTDSVLLEVTDTGCGMSAETVERAFEPFFTTKPVSEAAGLGLATVYAIVTKAHGTISLDSRPGAGTTVRILLPARDVPAGAPARAGSAGSAGSAATAEAPMPDGSAAPEARPQRAGAPAASRGGETVLVVDDERRMADALARVLAEAGYEVVVATSGPDALDVIRDRRVDLLLTDVVMPGMRGPALALAARERSPGLRVIFMSGYSDASITATDGLTGVMAKPFQADAVRIAVREALDADADADADGDVGAP